MGRARFEGFATGIGTAAAWSLLSLAAPALAQDGSEGAAQRTVEGAYQYLAEAIERGEAVHFEYLSAVDRRLEPRTSGVPNDDAFVRRTRSAWPSPWNSSAAPASRKRPPGSRIGKGA